MILAAALSLPVVGCSPGPREPSVDELTAVLMAHDAAVAADWSYRDVPVVAALYSDDTAWLVIQPPELLSVVAFRRDGDGWAVASSVHQPARRDGERVVGELSGDAHDAWEAFRTVAEAREVEATIGALHPDTFTSLSLWMGLDALEDTRGLERGTHGRQFYAGMVERTFERSPDLGETYLPRTSMPFGDGQLIVYDRWTQPDTGPEVETRVAWQRPVAGVWKNDHGRDGATMRESVLARKGR